MTSLAPALPFTSLTLPATGRLAPYGADTQARFWQHGKPEVVA